MGIEQDFMADAVGNFGQERGGNTPRSCSRSCTYVGLERELLGVSDINVRDMTLASISSSSSTRIINHPLSSFHDGGSSSCRTTPTVLTSTVQSSSNSMDEYHGHIVEQKQYSDLAAKTLLLPNYKIAQYDSANGTMTIKLQASPTSLVTACLGLVAAVLVASGMVWVLCSRSAGGGDQHNQAPTKPILVKVGPFKPEVGHPFTVHDWIAAGKKKPKQRFFPGGGSSEGDKACVDWSSPPGDLNFHCRNEFPEHRMANLIPHQSSGVLEFGGRYGTTTCAIARKLHNAKDEDGKPLPRTRTVTVEPDRSVFPSLRQNLRKHHCPAMIFSGVMSSTGPVYFKEGDGYASRSSLNQSAGKYSVPLMDFRRIADRANLVFDTLLLDCEGCLPSVLQEIEKYPDLEKEIRLILLEADMAEGASGCAQNCVDYGKPGGESGWIPSLEAKGFRVIENFDDCAKGGGLEEGGSWCMPGLWHYALLRCDGLMVDEGAVEGSFEELCNNKGSSGFSVS